MTLELRTVDAAGTTVHLHDNGRPLVFTLRMAAREMNLWTRIHPGLAEHCSIATFDLPVPDPATFDDPRDLFRTLGDRVVGVASALGHERFHLFGWAGGSTLGLHMLATHAAHLRSAILFQPIFPGADRRRFERAHQVLDALLRDGLETYTWWWLLTSFTPSYLEGHFDEVEAMVRRRLDADAGRSLDADRVSRWIRALQTPAVTAADLSAADTPTLLVATPGDVDSARRLQRILPRSEMRVVASGAFAPYEAPEAVLAAVRPFLSAAVKPPYVPAGGTIEPRAREAIVFLHGWLMSPAMWRAQLDALSGRYRCVALAQPGHGSPAPSDGSTMDDWTDATADEIRALGIDSAVLAGHSMGGFLALAIADRHPDLVAGLCLVGTTDEAWTTEERDRMIAAVDGCALAWGPDLATQIATILFDERSLPPAFVGTWTNEVAAFDLAGIARLGRAVAFRPDRTDASTRIAVPAVVIHSRDDRAMPIDAGRRMAARIGGARFVELGAAGHCPPLEMPDVVTTELEELCAKVLSVPRP